MNLHFWIQKIRTYNHDFNSRTRWTCPDHLRQLHCMKFQVLPLRWIVSCITANNESLAHARVQKCHRWRLRSKCARRGISVVFTDDAITSLMTSQFFSRPHPILSIHRKASGSGSAFDIETKSRLQRPSVFWWAEPQNCSVYFCHIYVTGCISEEILQSLDNPSEVYRNIFYAYLRLHYFIKQRLINSIYGAVAYYWLFMAKAVWNAMAAKNWLTKW